MSMTVYQIQYDDLGDRLDDQGSFENRATLAIKLGGSKNWNEAYWRMYAPVATVHTDDLDESFDVMNLWDRPELVEKHTDSVYSMSVGDIIKRGSEFFMVNPWGFGRIEVAQ